jgi:hypothetical protein
VDAETFLRAALDPVRLAILGRAISGPVDVDELTSALGVDRAHVVKAVGRLRGIGLLDANLTVQPETLRSLADSLEQQPVAASVITRGPWGKDEAQVLSHFFTGTRLKSVPVQRQKRRIVLERLAQEFEAGVRYAEKEVNGILEQFDPDHATLRRYLVDEGFMKREGGVYWRVGGRTNV